MRCQGISFLFSSGDNGDELANTALRQADYPASDPYVTAVGGTSDAIGPSGSFEWQTGWGTHKWVLSGWPLGSGRLPVRRGRRHVGPVQPAGLPGGRGARWGAAGPRRGTGRGSDDRHAGR